MRYKRLDLNLLVALDALLEEKNTTKAALRVTVSQSAMSGMLSRLRDYFDDEILMLVGRKMQRTPLGEELAVPVRELLLQIDSTITLRHEFVPHAAERHIRIAASDYLVPLLLAPLVRRLQQLAPRITIDLLPLHALPSDIIKSGHADLLLVPEDFASEEQPREPLISDGYTCVAWVGNTLVGESLDMATYLQCGHATPMFGIFRHHSLDEQFYRENGIERRLQVTTPNFESMVQVIIETDLLATMPTRLAELCAGRYPVKLLAPPMALPPLTYCMQWHRHHTADPCHRWVRGQLMALARAFAGDR